eukprot:205162_1
MQLINNFIIETFILLISLYVAHCNDILLFDEFQFSFSLLNEEDWDIYHISLNNNNPNEQTINYHGRRLIEEYENELLNNDYALKCTNRIPIIFKHLCLHWSSQNGFVFSYHSSINNNNNNDNKYQTDWFYDNRNDKISSAKNAATYYDTLDGDTWLMSDDKQWNEIDWISSLNNDDDDNNNIPLNNNKIKRCRYRKAIQECVHYDVHS